MSKIITISQLPPMITQSFSRELLQVTFPKGEDTRKYFIEYYLQKAFRKIRPQDNAKKREYDKIKELLEDIYEWKKDEAEKERVSRKEGKAFKSIPSIGGVMRFHRMGTKE